MNQVADSDSDEGPMEEEKLDYSRDNLKLKINLVWQSESGYIKVEIVYKR